MSHEGSSWTFITNHGHVLLCLAANADMTVREVAQSVGITERAVIRIIGELEEGITASASPQDLETLFQLLYLSVTAPRADPEAFQAFMTRMESFIENRQARPEIAFSDEIQLVTYGGHLRRRPISKEILNEIELATALEIFLVTNVSPRRGDS